MAVNFEQIRKMALAMDGVDETTSYGTPAFKVKGKLFARLHQDDKTFIVRMGFDQRDDFIAIDPDTFFIIDHYKDYEWLLVSMSRIKPDEMRKLLEISHQLRSPKSAKTAKPKRKPVRKQK